MLNKIKKCLNCTIYTLSQDKCPSCGGEVADPHPPGISLENKYLDLRVSLRRKSH